MGFWEIMASLSVIVILVLAGFVFAKKGWITKQTAPLLPQLVNRLALPTYMIWNFLTKFDKEYFFSIVDGIIVPYSAMLISFALSGLFGRYYQVPKARYGIFRSGFFASSAIFIGVPVCLALFGDESIPYVLIYFLANASLFWTLGNYSMSKSGTKGANYPFFSRHTLKLIFSPPLVSFICALILVVLEVRLPVFVLESFKYLGSMVIPLSMIFIGYTLSTVEFKDLRFTKDVNVLLLGRFVVSPLLALGLGLCFDLPPMMRQVFVVLSALPAMAQLPIMASVYGVDVKYAAISVSITTLLCLFVIPVYMLLF